MNWLSSFGCHCSFVIVIIVIDSFMVVLLLLVCNVVRLKHCCMGNMCVKTISKNNFVSLLKHSQTELKMICAAVYIMFGMALLAMCFNLMQVCRKNLVADSLSMCQTCVLMFKSFWNQYFSGKSGAQNHMDYQTIQGFEGSMNETHFIPQNKICNFIGLTCFRDRLSRPY